MLKNRDKNYNFVYILAFSASFFRFAGAVQEEKFTVKQWCFTVIINGILALILAVLCQKINLDSKIIKIPIAICLILFTSKQIMTMCAFLRIYHSEHSILATVIISLCAIAFAVNSQEDRLSGFAGLLLFMTLTLIIISLRANISKISPANLYTGEAGDKMSYFHLNFWDYAFPMVILSDKDKISNKIKTIFGVSAVCLLLCVFAFSAVRGDIMHNVSPMQILFLISSGSLVKNYDGYYNLLLYFSFMSRVILNSLRVRKLGYKRPAFLSLLPAVLMGFIPYKLLFYTGLFGALILYISRFVADEKT